MLVIYSFLSTDPRNCEAAQGGIRPPLGSRLLDYSMVRAPVFGASQWPTGRTEVRANGLNQGLVLPRCLSSPDTGRGKARWA